MARLRACSTLPGAPTRRAGAGGFAGALAGGLAALVLTLAAPACHPPSDPRAPLTGHLALCCKQAGPDNVSFAGCRDDGRCRTGESVWLRGPAACTAVTDACLGGRCCTLALTEARAEDAAAGGDEGQDPPPAAREPAPGPDPITPVPLDWQATPTPVAVPRYVCPATVERGVAGVVLLHVEVDANGAVTEVAIRRGLDPECDALARDALLHAEFEPALGPDGRPIPASLRWVVRFGDGPSPSPSP